MADSPSPQDPEITPDSAPDANASPDAGSSSPEIEERLDDAQDDMMAAMQAEMDRASSPPADGGDDEIDMMAAMQAEMDKAAADSSDAIQEATAQPPQPFALDELAASVASDSRQPIDLIGDVEMELHVELGRTMMRLEDVLKLRDGSVVALDKLAGDPVDIFANGRLIARGEVLVMNDNFCVRVTELVGA